MTDIEKLVDLYPEYTFYMLTDEDVDPRFHGEIDGRTIWLNGNDTFNTWLDTIYHELEHTGDGNVLNDVRQEYRTRKRAKRFVSREQVIELFKQFDGNEYAVAAELDVSVTYLKQLARDFDLVS